MAVEIIAEIANAHQGDPDKAARLAEEALEAGADAVKFQVYTAEELLVRGHPRYEHFKGQAFPRQAWPLLIGGVKALGGRVYCDVFGLDALDVALTEDADGVKVHSSDLTNTPLLSMLTGTDRRVLLSVGGSTMREIAYAVRHVASDAIRPVLMHGFQSYPTAVEDSCLARLQWLARYFGERCDIGYQDHVAGDDPFAVTLPIMALGMGATVIEKHITLDRAAEGVDWYSSLNPDEFAAFVRSVRLAEAAIGETPGRFAEAEREYRRTIKKHWTAARALPMGHVLAAADLVMKRVHEAPGQAVELEKLIGRPLKSDIAEEEALTRADVPQTVWALVLARMRSSRLPGKALIDIGGQPALCHLFARLKQANTVDRVVLCTTLEDEDDPLAALALDAGVGLHRGQVEDVLGRMLGALEGHGVDVVLRVTGDDLLVDPDYLDRAVRHHLSVNAEYSELKQLPSGTEVEVFDADLLGAIHRASADPDGTEYLTNYVTDHADQFRRCSVPVEPAHAHDWRLTLDTPEDYQVISGLVEAMAAKGKALDYRLDDIVEYFTAHPGKLAANSHVRQLQTPPGVDTDMDWSVFAGRDPSPRRRKPERDGTPARGK